MTLQLENKQTTIEQATSKLTTETMIYDPKLWNQSFSVGDTLTAVLICISLRSIWRKKGCSLEVAEHQALLKFKRPLPALAFTGSEVDEAVVWASEMRCFSIPSAGKSSELGNETGFHYRELSWSIVCSSHASHMWWLESLGIVSILTPFRTYG